MHCTKSGHVHYAHMACAVARITPRWRECRAPLPVQVVRTACAGRALRVRMSRIAPKSWAHVATLFPSSIPWPGHDIVPRLRPPGRLSQVATSIPCRDLPSAQQKLSRSRPENGVATPTSMGQQEPCRDIKSVSRHHSGESRSRPQNGIAIPRFSCPAPSQVATLKLGRDPPGDQPMSRHQFHVATSFQPTVGFPSRDTKNPGRDLPHCHPCHDLKSNWPNHNLKF